MLLKNVVKWIKDNAAGIAGVLGNGETAADVGGNFAKYKSEGYNNEQTVELIARSAAVDFAASRTGATVGRFAGAAIGQVLIPAPGVGAAVGAVVAGMAVKAAYDNIKPFRDTVSAVGDGLDTSDAHLKVSHIKTIFQIYDDLSKLVASYGEMAEHDLQEFRQVGVNIQETDQEASQ